MCRQKNRTVEAALQQNTWICDIGRSQGLTLGHIQEYFTLWEMLRGTQLDENQEDQIKWKFTASGEYTAASAYKAQFLGNVKVPKAQTIWRAWAPPKCKFFAWLVTHDRVWTSDRLMRRGWPHSPSSPLCRNAPETALHLLAECRYTKRVWNLIAEWLAQPTLRPEVWRQSDHTLHWWTNITSCEDMPRKGIKSLSLLVIWEIWRERNARVFRKQETSAPGLLAKIKNEAGGWALAGAKDLELLLLRD